MLPRLSRAALVAHIAMMAFGAAGILVALPNPELWQGEALAQRTYEFGMRHGGPLQIWLGAAAMATWALSALGRGRLAIFLAASTGVSLAAELFGTKTGWPFGGYAYLDGLGAKILGRVPYTIPMSWFFMGLASYALGSALASRVRRPGLRTAAGLVVGSWLLVAWDLVLDPAMAHESLPVRFWVWFDDGSYFGMPLQNFAGWMATGLTFMGLSRLLWRRDLALDPHDIGVPLACYLANVTFAASIALGVGLWQPVAIVVPVAVLPALAARAIGREGRFGRRFVRAAARILVRRLEVHAEGVERVPTEGPTLLAVRHVHNLYDGALLTATLPRPPSILVALDWAGTGALRRLMEWHCRLAGWPVIERPGRERFRAGPMAAGMRTALERLCAGELLAVFPEGRPVYDPHAGNRPDELLPFGKGAAWLATRAAARLGRPVPVFPVGLTYCRPSGGKRRWRVELRVGTPIMVRPEDDEAALTAQLEAEVRRLSGFAGEPLAAVEGVGAKE